MEGFSLYQIMGLDNYITLLITFVFGLVKVILCGGEKASLLSMYPLVKFVTVKDKEKNLSLLNQLCDKTVPIN